MRTLEELLRLLWWLLAVPWLAWSLLGHGLALRTGDEWAHAIVIATVCAVCCVVRLARRLG